jgi:hypothetical protein
MELNRQLLREYRAHQLWLHRRESKYAKRLDWSNRDLRNSDLRNSNLRYSNLRDSDLRRSNLSGSDLRYSNLRYSNLRSSDLRYSNLSSSDLRGSDLRGSDLRGSDLSGVVGNMREIKSGQLESWLFAYTSDRLQIGCENHAIADWWDFSDDRISQMDTEALAWWRKWKPILRQIIEMSPAIATGKEGSDAIHR